MGGWSVPPPAQLELRPQPPTPGPLETVAQMQELRGQRQLMDLRAMQQQEAQLNMQQRRAVNEAYQQAFTVGPDGKPQLDREKLTGALATSGHGEAIPGIMEGWTKYEQSLAGLAETKQKVAAAEADAAGNLGATVQAAGNDPHLFHTLLTDAVNRGIIEGSHYAPLDQQIGQALQQDPTGEQARAMVKQFTGHMIAGSPKQQELANARTTAEARESTATTAKARETREAGQQQFQNAISDLAAMPPRDASEYSARIGKLPPNVATRILQAVPPSQYDASKSVPILRQLGMTPEQQTQAAQAAANATRTAAHEKVTEEQGRQRLAIERENANRLQRQFDATYGALLDPNGKPLDAEAAKALASQDPIAVSIANYQNAPPGRAGSGQAAMIMRKVMAINPTYNAQNWQAKAAMMKGYTSGSQSKEISGINTALGHVGVLGEAIDALNNSDLQALNRIGNFLQVQTGGDAVTTFKAIVHKVAPELNRAYVGGVGAQGEILAQESDFDPKLGVQQLRSNVAVTAKLLRSKIGSLENQWKQTMGSNFEDRFIMPEAKTVVDKWAPQQSPANTGGGGGRGASGGSGQAAPQLPANLTQADIGKTYISPKTGKRMKITAVNPQNPKQFQSQDLP